MVFDRKAVDRLDRETNAQGEDPGPLGRQPSVVVPRSPAQPQGPCADRRSEGQTWHQTEGFFPGFPGLGGQGGLLQPEGTAVPGTIEAVNVAKPKAPPGTGPGQGEASSATDPASQQGGQIGLTGKGQGGQDDLPSALGDPPGQMTAEHRALVGDGLGTEGIDPALDEPTQVGLGFGNLFHGPKVTENGCANHRPAARFDKEAPVEPTFSLDYYRHLFGGQPNSDYRELVAALAEELEAYAGDVEQVVAAGDRQALGPLRHAHRPLVLNLGLVGLRALEVDLAAAWEAGAPVSRLADLSARFAAEARTLARLLEAEARAG